MDVSLSTKKKNKPKSFWNRLAFHKSKREKNKNLSAASSMNGLPEDFVTLESSALTDVHNDAGILFMNKESMKKCFVLNSNNNKQVQFVPTSMNKYYLIDRKNGSLSEAEKENIEHMNQSILRSNKKMDNSVRNISRRHYNGAAIHSKSPSMTRTSTKLALMDHKNNTLHQLSVSGIYNSSSFNGLEALDKSTISYDHTLSQLNQGQKLQCAVEDTGKAANQFNHNRQSCSAIPDQITLLDAKKVLKNKELTCTNSVLKQRCVGVQENFHSLICDRSKHHGILKPFKTKTLDQFSSDHCHVSTDFIKTIDKSPFVAVKRKEINQPLCDSKLNRIPRQSQTCDEYQKESKSNVLKCSKMYAGMGSNFVNKRVFQNKKDFSICKDGSRQQEDSCMADDECSFSCSCQRCIRHSNIKNLDGEKFFFEIEPKLKDHSERLRENRVLEGTMAKAQPQLFCCKPDTSTQNVNACCLQTHLNELKKNICSNIAESKNCPYKKDLKFNDLFFSTPMQSPLKLDTLTTSLTKRQKMLLSDSKIYNDSVFLMKEIFQKLSQECQELLRPNQSLNTKDSSTSNSTYLNDFVNSFKSIKLNGSNFEISQSDALKQFPPTVTDLRKSFLHKAVNAASSLVDLRQVTPNKNRINERNIRGGNTTKCSETDPNLTPTSRSKKKLSSPITKYKSRDLLSGKGKLKLKVICCNNTVTVFVLKAGKLTWAAGGRDLNCYVKVVMGKRVHWRTRVVQKAQAKPHFNQKFSFKLLEGEDESNNRLVFSVWHRDFVKRRSELIGCMSFSLRHVLRNNNNIDGWYRLLREKFGMETYFSQ